jgi:hypothetical protein
LLKIIKINFIGLFYAKMKVPQWQAKSILRRWRQGGGEDRSGTPAQEKNRRSAFGFHFLFYQRFF